MSSKRSKTITIEEFRAWLDGVEEMQDTGWFPSGEQWKKIRAKILQIETSEQLKKRVAVPNRQQTPAATPRTSERVPVMPQVPAPMDPITGPSILDTPTAPPTGPAPMANQEGVKVKTPDIDTANGQYNSNFI